MSQFAQLERQESNRDHEAPAAARLEPHVGSGAVSDANAVAQANAQKTVDSKFGSISITDAGQAKICDLVKNSPIKEGSAAIVSAEGSGHVTGWHGGVGKGASFDSKGNGSVCVVYGADTTVSATGKIRKDNADGEVPIMPDNVQVVSPGGKVEYQPDADGTAKRISTARDGGKAVDKTSESMEKSAANVMERPDLKVIWAKSDKDGPHFVFNSSDDPAVIKDAIQAWKKKHGVQE